MKFLALFALVASAAAFPSQVVPYIHDATGDVAVPYVHEEIAAEPYVHIEPALAPEALGNAVYVNNPIQATGYAVVGYGCRNWRGEGVPCAQ